MGNEGACQYKLDPKYLWNRIFILLIRLARIGWFGKLRVNGIGMAARTQFGVNHGCRLFDSPIDE